MGSVRGFKSPHDQSMGLTIPINPLIGKRGPKTINSKDAKAKNKKLTTYLQEFSSQREIFQKSNSESQKKKEHKNLVNSYENRFKTNNNLEKSNKIQISLHPDWILAFFFIVNIIYCRQTNHLS